jgi:hypothetical protein
LKYKANKEQLKGMCSDKLSEKAKKIKEEFWSLCRTFAMQPKILHTLADGGEHVQFLIPCQAG